jgi:hypothetical protein
MIRSGGRSGWPTPTNPLAAVAGDDAEPMHLVIAVAEETTEDVTQDVTSPRRDAEDVTSEDDGRRHLPRDSDPTAGTAWPTKIVELPTSPRQLPPTGRAQSVREQSPHNLGNLVPPEQAKESVSGPPPCFHGAGSEEFALAHAPR